MADRRPVLNQYFVQVNGQRYGPVAMDVLRRWAAEKRIHPPTEVVDALEGTSREAREVPGLFESTWIPEQRSSVEPSRPRKRWPAWAKLTAAFGVLTTCGLLAVGAFLDSRPEQGLMYDPGLRGIKRLALSALMYASDYDDFLPAHMLSANQLRPYLSPYAQERGIFSSKNPNGGELLANTKLGGICVSDVPARTVMFYDSMPWSKGNGLEANVDGSGKYIPFRELEERLRADPTKIYSSK